MKWIKDMATERNCETICFVRVFAMACGLGFLILSARTAWISHTFDCVPFAESAAKLIAAIGGVIFIKALTESKPNAD